MVILVVIAGLAIPNFSKTFARLELQTTADNLAYLMRYAQSRAVTQARRHRLVFDEKFFQYWLEMSSSENEEIETAKIGEEFQRIPSRLGKTSQVPEGIVVQSTLPAVYFNSDGTIDKMTISLSNKKDCLSISTRKRAQDVEIYPCEETSQK